MNGLFLPMNGLFIRFEAGRAICSIPRDESRGYVYVSPTGLHIFIAGLILICDHAVLLLLLETL